MKDWGNDPNPGPCSRVNHKNDGIVDNRISTNHIAKHRVDGPRTRLLRQI